MGFSGKMVEGDEKYASFLFRNRNLVFCSIAVTKTHPMMQLIRKQSHFFLSDVFNNVFVPSESLCVAVQGQ